MQHLDDPRKLASQLSGRQILLLDLDEVVVQFVVPFAEFVQSQGLDFELSRFLAPHNVVDPQTGLPVPEMVARTLREEFNAQQWVWQRPVDGALPALDQLRTKFDLVYLSASEERFKQARIRLLEMLGLPDPLRKREARTVQPA